MINFLKETLEAIKESGHKINDIVFIGSLESGYYCEWVEFEKLADQEYEDGYGAQKVAPDLIVLFDDGSKLWRCEYDGSEWWEFDKPIFKYIKAHKIRSLFTKRIGWDDLQEINK